MRGRGGVRRDVRYISSECDLRTSSGPAGLGGSLMLRAVTCDRTIILKKCRIFFFHVELICIICNCNVGI